MFKSYAEDVSTALKTVDPEKVRSAAEILRRVRQQNATVYIVGNGGSAATASHFANDLLKMCGIRAVALTDLSPTVTAYGNDYGWDQMFSRTLRALLLPQDAVIFISCSGNSANVVDALLMVKNINLPMLRTIVLTGADMNCQLAKWMPNVIIHVMFRDIRVQEDCHLVICHYIAGAIAYAASQTD